MTHAVSVILEDELLTLNRAVGVLRRQNLPIGGITVGPCYLPGTTRLTIMLNTDDTTAAQVVKQLHKTIGVREAVMFHADDGIARELALVKVRASHDTYAELLNTVSLFRGTVADEGPDAIIVELAGSGSLILSFLRSVERFGILEIARSGPVALERAAGASLSSPESH